MLNKKVLISLFLFVSTTLVLGQPQMSKLVWGTVKNPDGSTPGIKEVKYTSYLSSEVTDSTHIDSTTNNGGWAIDLNDFNNTGSEWGEGDTLFVLFENIASGGEFNGVTSVLKHIVGSESDYPQQISAYTLPVELVTFASQVEKGLLYDNVLLSWKTLGESNNFGFAVERSFDGTRFEEIGFIAGAGSTNTARHYEYKDDQITQPGIYSYRLKQIDNDGTFTYSRVEEITLNTPEHYELLQNYPNPFNPETTIAFKLKEDTRVNITIFNVLGREVETLVDKKMKAGTHQIVFNAGTLPSGMYFYHMKTGDFNHVRKMVLIK